MDVFFINVNLIVQLNAIFYVWLILMSVCYLFSVYNLDLLADHHWLVTHLSKVMGMFTETSDYFDVDDGGNNYNMYTK